MDIVKYPLTAETIDGVLNRLEEECSELIKAICKRRRFGAGSIYPRTGETAEMRILSECDDVTLVLEELAMRMLRGEFK